MADDIDIEEHDVMDNPAIKNMFPDLAIVKRELVGFGIEESATKPHRKTRALIKSQKMCPSYITDDAEDTSIISEPIIKHYPIVTSTQLDKEYKPKLLCLDDQVAEAIEPKPVIELDDKSNDSDSQFFGNKLILGRKPANLNTETATIKPKQDAEMEKCLTVKVVVEDMDGFLMKNKAYCLQCKTLFADVKSYNSHKNFVHFNQQVAESGDVTNRSSDIDGHKFQCDICHYSVTRLYNLRRHYRSKHFCEIPEKLVAKYKTSKANKETLPVRTHEQTNKTVGQGPVDRYISSIVATEKLTNVRKKPPGSINKDNLCNHCNSTFPTKEELISHLYNILKPKTVPCPECPLKFDDQEDLDKHSLEHNKIESHQIVEVFKARNTRKRKAKLSENEDSQDSVVIMDEYPKTTKRKKLETPNEPDNAPSTSVAEQTDKSAELLKRVIPISTLFKCPSCCFHFMTYISVVNHEKNCRKTKRTGKFQCEDCVITFDGPLHYKIHLKQHFHTNEFNIIPVKFGVDMTKMILCHCPKCGVHYSEQKFWSHFEHCEDDTPKSTYCRKCDILIEDGINDAHSESHQGQNAKNFIFIDFEEVIVTKSASKKNHKRKRSDDSDEDYQMTEEICVSDEEYESLEESSVADEYNSTNSNDYCYCNTCNCYSPFGYKQGIAYHAKKRCQDLEPGKKLICKQCGIMMTAKALDNHRIKHVNQHNYTIFDSKFYNLNGEIINPPVPRFKYCGECKVFYVHLKQGVHVCNRDSKNTKYCNKCDCTYSEVAYSLHSNFHAYSEKHPNNKYDDVSGNGIKYIRYNKKYYGKRKNLYNNEDGLDDGNDKEEVKRLRFTFWQRNVRRLFTLFQCSTCDVMVSEGNVEAHMNIQYNCNSVKNMYKKCEDCDFAIAGKDLKDHLLYHTMNREFNRDQIKIIPFDKAVDINKIEIISDTEVYFSEDDIEEDQKYIFYQCRNCKCNLTKGCEKLKHHKCYVSPKIKKFQRQRECPLCKLSVNTHTLGRHYEWHKINRDLTHSNMKIIKFGKKDANSIKKSKEQSTLNVSFKQKEKETGTEAKNSNDNKSLPNPQDSNNEENISGDKLYQCKNCKLNYYNELVIREHTCEKKIPYRCLGCKYTFDKTEYEKHIKFHLNPDYTRASIKTVVFDRISKVEHVVKKPAAIVKYVSATKSNEPTHSDKNRAIHSNEISTTHSDDRQIAVAIDDVPQTETNERVETIYKCSCGLHFLTKQSAVDHNEICGPKVRSSKQNCTKCHLLFTPNVLFDHLMNHHGSKKSEFKFQVIEVSQMLKTKDTLYACAECELLFVEKSTMAGHAHRCGKKKYEDGKKCLQCGLNFYNEDISFHEMKHHNKTKLEENDFDIAVLKLEDYIQNASKPFEELEDTDPEEIEEVDDQANDSEKIVVEPCEPVIVGPSSYNNVIYKCKKCNLCYLNFGTFQGHVVYEKHKHPPKRNCTICGYVFTEVSLIKHKQVHHDMLNLAREDFIIEYNHLVEEKFTMTNKLKTKIDLNKKYGNVLYKCSDCVIYFMLENSAHQHVKSFHLTFKNTKQCNICKLNFSLNSLARHNYLHHEKQNLQLKDIEIVEYPYKKEDGTIQFYKSKPANKWNVSDETLRNIMLNKFSNKVYQCDRCDVNFVTKAALESHVNTQNHKYLTLRSECDVCGLKFLEPSLARHIYIHHENMKCQLEDLEIVTEIQPSQRRKKKQKVDPKLYKCKPCDNHFMTLETCKSHTFYTHQPVIKEKILKCEICNLNFLKPSLRKHKQLHHVDNNFTLKDFIIEEYEPMPYNESGHLRPKVETYIAADRINSNTTDEYQEISSVENGDSLEGDDKTSKKDSLLTFEVPKYVPSDKIIDTPAHLNSEQNNQSLEDNIKNNTRGDKGSSEQNMQLPTVEQKFNKNLSENTETKEESNHNQEQHGLGSNEKRDEKDFLKEDVGENDLPKEGKKDSDEKDENSTRGDKGSSEQNMQLPTVEQKYNKNLSENTETKEESNHNQEQHGLGSNEKRDEKDFLKEDVGENDLPKEGKKDSDEKDENSTRGDKGSSEQNMQLPTVEQKYNKNLSENTETKEESNHYLEQHGLGSNEKKDEKDFLKEDIGENDLSKEGKKDSDENDEKSTRGDKGSSEQNMQLPTVEQKYNKNLSENTETKKESNDNQSSSKKKDENDFSKENVGENDLSIEDKRN